MRVVTPRSFSEARPVGFTLAAIGVALLATGARAQDSPTPKGERVVDSRITEEVEVRYVQIDVSVIDPKGSTYASVPGLNLDHFDIRIDGLSLDAAQKERVILDEICETPSQEVVEDLLPDDPRVRRPVIALIDFNYLDAASRSDVSDAIDAIAESAKSDGVEIFKIYAMTRQLRLLTDGFTRDPDELRAVAQTVRDTAFTERRLGATGGVPSLDSAGLIYSNEQIGLPGFDLVGTAEALLVESNLRTLADALSEYEPRRSFAMIESVMLTHNQIPGRKMVVLFTSEAFRIMREEVMVDELNRIKELSRSGYTFWTVDSFGIRRSVAGDVSRASVSSELLESIALDTGGGSVRNSSDLGLAFERAVEQASCYYLFSVPVETRSDRSVRKHLVVRLDTEKYPEIWRYKITAPGYLQLPSRQTIERDRRLAALLSPDDFGGLGVSVTLDYPLAYDDRDFLPVRLRIPLADLTWIPDPDPERTGVIASFLAEAVVEIDGISGSRPVCEIGVQRTGTLQMRLPAMPDPESSTAAAIELPCRVKDDGLYTARGVVTDLETGSVGAGRSTAYLNRKWKSKRGWAAFAPRVEAVTGNDFIWKPGASQLAKDRLKAAWYPIDSEKGGLTKNRHALRYVLCGPDPRESGGALSHRLLRDDVDGTRSVFQAFKPDSLELLSSPDEGRPFCSQAAVLLPEYSLPPGSYRFEVSSTDETAESPFTFDVPFRVIAQPSAGETRFRTAP